MNIALGSDHAGYDLKRAVIRHLEAAGHVCTDCGAETASEPASYVPAAVQVAQQIHEGKVRFGILICGTGLGISISANKINGIRAALCSDEYSARMSRQHNNANVLAMGARVVGSGLACSIADAFLSEAFESGGRHQVRVNEMMALEQQEEAACGE